MKFGIRELIFLLLMGGVVASSYTFVFKPGLAKGVNRQTETTNKNRALRDLQQSTSGIKDFEKKLDELQLAIHFFESKLPQEKEVDKILKEVWQMAEANRLQTKTVKTLKSEKNAGYSEQPIQMSLAGDFDGFYSFLLQLEKLSRITRLSQLKLDKITGRDGEMTAQFTLSIFFESENSPRSVASAR